VWVERAEVAEEGRGDGVLGMEVGGEGAEDGCALLAEPVAVRNGSKGGFGTEEVEGGGTPLATKKLSSIPTVVAHVMVGVV
jgi:hypothetical protein